MSIVEKTGLWALRRLDPELAHRLSLQLLNSGLVPLPGPVSTPRLRCSLAGMDLPNPIGLAAGYDKNAVALAPLGRAGFGFVEVGAATPKPQPGNPKPRLFRLPEDQAVINRFGFNNHGATTISDRLARRKDTGIVGLNLGANKDSADRVQDYLQVLEICGNHVDFVTVNVSSPNTEKLRDLQGKAALTDLLREVLSKRDSLARPPVVFLKIAPDLDDTALADVAKVALQVGLDGIIATNTTLIRDGLTADHRQQAGGLSGQPLFEPSTKVLAALARHLDGNIPLIGVGGIGSAEQAYAKIKAGAVAVQLYTAMIYQGMSLVADMAHGLDKLLAQDGFDNVAQAVGVEKNLYA